MFRSRLLAVALTVVLAGGVAPAFAADEPISLGTRRELFVDHFLIEKLAGAFLQLQHPQPAGIALKFDQPWEGQVSGYVTVIHDGDLYRLPGDVLEAGASIGEKELVRTGPGAHAVLRLADGELTTIGSISGGVSEFWRGAGRVVGLGGAGGLYEVLAFMDQEVAQAEPGAHGLIFTPWMYGERAPLADESLRAAFINLSVNHTHWDLARAVYEGIAFNLRWILDLMKELYGFDPQTLRVLGGGARGLPWLRVISDVTGRRLEVLPNPRERLAVGAALVAAVGLGIYPSIEATKNCVPVDHVFEPDPAPRRFYMTASTPPTSRPTAPARPVPHPQPVRIVFYSSGISPANCWMETTRKSTPVTRTKPRASSTVVKINSPPLSGT